MIIGIGSDLCDIRRIEKSLERFGDRFTGRTFTSIERERSERKVNAQGGRAASYAKRFAAKEACAKALGTGVPRRGVHWADMGVINLRSGKPTMALTGGAAVRLAGSVGVEQQTEERESKREMERARGTRTRARASAVCRVCVVRA